jgi:TonB family protein
MHTLQCKPTFPALLGAALTLVSIANAQQPHLVQATKTPPKSGQSSVLTSAMAEQQRQFCAVFREDEARHRSFEAKVAGAGSNPIQRRLEEKDPPDFNALFDARQFTVMGDGGFQNWVGTLILTVAGDKAYVAIEFPCPWVDYQRFSGERHEHLYVGNGFGSPPMPGSTQAVFGEGVPIDAPAGRALATMTPGEAVSVSGALACQLAGCRAVNSAEPNMFVATIASIRSLKTGAAIQLSDKPRPISNFDRIDARRKSKITFLESDDPETLREKARALVWQEPTANSIKLMEYLYSSAGCDRCPRDKRFEGASLIGYDLDASGRAVERRMPCPPGVPSNTICVDSTLVYVEGDVPGLKEEPTTNGDTFVPGRNGKCYLVTPGDQTAIRRTTQRIRDLLLPLGMRLEPSPTPRQALSDVCGALNRSLKRDAGARESARKQMLDETKAVSVNTGADRFALQLQAAVSSRAVKLGADPAQYADAIKAVSKLVLLCSSISEADFSELMYQTGRRYAAEKYKDCLPTGMYRGIPEATGQPGLLVRHDLRNHWDAVQQRWYTDKFHIDVLLNPLPDEKVTSDDQFEANHIVISAEVANNGSVAEPRFVCPGTRIKESFSDGHIAVSAPTRITRVESLKSGQVAFWLEGSDTRYEGFVQQVRGSCTDSDNISGRTVYSTGDGVSAPVATLRINPQYPKGAIGSGEVLISVIVDEHGIPGDIEVVRGLGSVFDQNAIEAVQKCKFSPGMKDGKPVAVYTTITVGFSDTSNRKAAFTPPVSQTAPSEPHTLKLTPDSPVAQRSATIVAPGRGFQNYNVYYIDARDFAGGGVLEIEIEIPRDSPTDGSFDLFPPNVRIPTKGLPDGAIQGRHDVRKGTSTRFQYRFSSGLMLALGLEGNWFSPKGASGTVHFRATVHK